MLSNKKIATLRYGIKRKYAKDSISDISSENSNADDIVSQKRIEEPTDEPIVSTRTKKTSSFRPKKVSYKRNEQEELEIQRMKAYFDIVDKYKVQMILYVHY